MNNFWQRTLTGALFVALLIGAIFWTKYSFILLLFITCLLGLLEYVNLFKDRTYKPDIIATVTSGAGLCLIWSVMFILPTNDYLEHNAVTLMVICLLLSPVISLIHEKKLVINNIQLSLLAVLYLNLGLFCFAGIAFLKYYPETVSSGPYNRYILLGYLILLWSSDTFAYLTGRALGKTPLAPKISPKKNWEGSIGGAVCTILISLLLYKTIGFLTLYQWIGLSVIIVVFGTIGDLIESRLKRVLGVKDSGNILPGHGGILDRFDSLLFSAPFAYAFLVLTTFY
jgi:phosphatidate cytidylyltransferase